MKNIEKVDLVITDTPAFQILNEAMKEMKRDLSYNLFISWPSKIYKFL
jgi:hypothetical protein